MSATAVSSFLMHTRKPGLAIGQQQQQQRN